MIVIIDNNNLIPRCWPSDISGIFHSDVFFPVFLVLVSCPFPSTACRDS